MKSKAGRKPLVPTDIFVECWNRHHGDVDKVAEELKLKPNTVYVRGSRLLKERGIKQDTTFEMGWEEL